MQIKAICFLLTIYGVRNRSASSVTECSSGRMRASYWFGTATSNEGHRMPRPVSGKDCGPSRLQLVDSGSKGVLPGVTRPIWNTLTELSNTRLSDLITYPGCLENGLISDGISERVACGDSDRLIRVSRCR